MTRLLPLSLLLATLPALAQAPADLPKPADAAKEVTVMSGGESVRLAQSSDGSTLRMTLQGGTLTVGECGTRRLRKARKSSIRAVVEERNCGATVDFATVVLLQIDGGRYPAVVFAGRPRVALAIESGRLLIRHSPVPDDQIFGQRSQVQGIAVAYEVRGEPVGQTPPDVLNFSSLNYGATGRAAGIPAEALARVAGWSQAASGLWRPEWGRWNEAARYGDDPDGSASVLEGIACLESGRCGGQ